MPLINFPAEALDVDLNQVGKGIKSFVPNMFRDFGPAHHPINVAGQVVEQGIFLGGELDGAVSRPDADDSCRGVYQLTPVASSTFSSIIVVTATTEPLSDQLDALENVLAIAIVIALLLAGGGGWLLARHSLSPLAAMASATERITANNLGERLPVGASEELRRLASRFNDLLSRLSASFSQPRQFMADASHELRTPLSVVRTSAQVALQKPDRSTSEYREALAVIEQQAGRLSRIVEDMFELTRADMNQLPPDIAELYLDEVIADTARVSGFLAQRKGIHLKSQEKKHPIVVMSACCGR